MPERKTVDALQSYLKTQRRRSAEIAGEDEAETGHPFITLSRQAGTDALMVAEHLAASLDALGIGIPDAPWQVFGKNLLHRVAEEHGLPPEVVRDLEADAVPEIQSIMEEMFGFYPSAHSMAAKTTRTILGLARQGSAVIIGRGGNLITRRLSAGYRVRLIGSSRHRASRIMLREDLSRALAEEAMRKEDEARRRYVRNSFHREIEDSALYDLVVRTDRLSPEQTTAVILEGLRMTLL